MVAQTGGKQVTIEFQVDQTEHDAVPDVIFRQISSPPTTFSAGKGQIGTLIFALSEPPAFAVEPALRERPRRAWCNRDYPLRQAYVVVDHRLFPCRHVAF